MAHYYRVLNGTTAMTVEDIRMYPNLQCVDGENGNIQYVETYQHDGQQVVISQQDFQHQQIVIDNGHAQNVAYVVEEVDVHTQGSVTSPEVHQQEQQIHQQIYHQQQQQQQQQPPPPPQQQQQQIHPQQQYFSAVPVVNHQTSPDTVLQPAYVQRSPDIKFVPGQAGMVESLQQQQMAKAQVTESPKVARTSKLPPSATVREAYHSQASVADWPQLQQAAPKLARAGVITMTRQPVGQGISPLIPHTQPSQSHQQEQQHQQLLHHHQQQQQQQQRPQARQYPPSRPRQYNRRSRTSQLVANNTVQAIASTNRSVTPNDGGVIVEQMKMTCEETVQTVPAIQSLPTAQAVPTVQTVPSTQAPPPEPDSQTTTTQMLILLPNGDQGVVNFNFPKGTMTINQLLEQVGIVDGNVTVFDGTTEQLEQTVPVLAPRAEEAVVTEQALDSKPQPEHQLSPKQLEQCRLLDDKTRLQTQQYGSTNHEEALVPVRLPESPGDPVAQLAPKPEEPPDIKPVTKEEPPRYVPGKLAVCQYCGITSLDFNRCQRCKRKLPDTVKVVPAPDSSRKQREVSNEKSSRVKPDSFLENSKLSCHKRVGRTTPKKNKAKLVEEPVCLVLSSDDEDATQQEVDAGSDQLNSQLSADGMYPPDPEATSSAMDKEPEIPEEAEEDEDVPVGPGVSGGGCDLDLDMDKVVDGSMPGPFSLIKCRTVRLGSYKVIPQDHVMLSPKGVCISVPMIGDPQHCVPLTIPISSVMKLLVHFGRGMPVLFLYTTASAASRVRTLLGMTSPEGPYYDPKSQDETQKRITLLPERLNEEAKVALKSMYGSFKGLMLELNNKEANDILVRASPKEIQALMKKSCGLQSPGKSKDKVQTILVYPPPPTKGGIPINTEDYACLGAEQFLNDVIIDFYLKYLTLSVLSEHDQARTHVFSSFFYKRLTTKPPKTSRKHPIEDDPKLSPAEKRHSRVKSWTKHVNIFEKDFIIIPINENCHWFLAIICFPGLTGWVRISDNTPVTPGARSQARNSGKCSPSRREDADIEKLPQPVIAPTITLDTSCEDGSDRDEAEGEDEDMSEPSTSEEEDNGARQELYRDVPELTQKPPTPPPPSIPTATSTPVSLSSLIPFVARKRAPRKQAPHEPIKQPCILIFDSLSGASRARVVATLRDYLRIEYRVKHGKERDFNKDTIRGACPKVPQQGNYSDCGVYLLQYVESFFQAPIKDYYLPMMGMLKAWFPVEVVNRKRQDIQQLILQLMDRADIENICLPELRFGPFQESQGQEEMEVDEPEHEVNGYQEVESSVLISGTEEDVVGSLREPSSEESHSDDTFVSSSDTEPVRTLISERNTMMYLKSKRIKRHTQRDSDDTVKKQKHEEADTNNR